MTPPTVSRDGPGLLVDGLFGGPHGIGPGAARVLLRGRQFAEMLVPDEAGNGVPGGIAYVTEGDQVRFRPGSALTTAATRRRSQPSGGSSRGSTCFRSNWPR